MFSITSKYFSNFNDTARWVAHITRDFYMLFLFIWFFFFSTILSARNKAFQSNPIQPNSSMHLVVQSSTKNLNFGPKINFSINHNNLVDRKGVLTVLPKRDYCSNFMISILDAWELTKLEFEIIMKKCV